MAVQVIISPTCQLGSGENVKGKEDLDCVIWQESNLAEKEVLSQVAQ